MKPTYLAIPISFLLSGLLVSCAGMLPGTGTNNSTHASGTKGTSAPAKTSAPAASASGNYSVTLGVTSRSGRLGAVQFDARIKGGDWQGSGGSVACRNVSGAAMLACNDKGGGTLSCALIDQGGIATPNALVVCGLSSSKPIAAADFSVKVVDASTPAMKPAKATVAVTKIVAN
jgi:hypothetical protein